MTAEEAIQTRDRPRKHPGSVLVLLILLLGLLLTTTVGYLWCSPNPLRLGNYVLVGPNCLDASVRVRLERTQLRHALRFAERQRGKAAGSEQRILRDQVAALREREKAQVPWEWQGFAVIKW